MTPIETSGLDREDLQPVPESFPESFKIIARDRATFDGKPIKFSFPGYLRGEGTLHVSEPSPKGNSLAMIMASNSFPDVATVFHFYLSQDKFEKIRSTDQGLELHL